MTGFALVSFLGTLTVVAATDVKPATQVECESPFTEVGGRCVHVALTTSGSWHDMRKYCQELGGELVNLADVQFYSDLILYIEILLLLFSSCKHSVLGSSIVGPERGAQHDADPSVHTQMPSVSSSVVPIQKPYKSGDE
ncbi:hypothetical protein O3P69_015393 [Scylla paramamosain]|uniref:C-type lectin domain-containing protein n=1 Tax=Scylla paramamosain TaxID=85552 RepID=A0AAW0T4X6_SCYPA